MANTEVLLKLLLGILYLVGTCVSGLVLAAFKSYLDTRDVEKKLLAKREEHQDERLRKLEAALRRHTPIADREN